MENNKKCCNCNCNMEKNVGKVDKSIRVGTGAALLASALLCKNTPGKLLSLLGAGVLLATGISGKCPAYQAAGINTNCATDNDIID